MNQSLRTRDQIPHAHRWSTEDLYASPAEWERAIADLDPELAQLESYAGRLHEGPATLLACLEQVERVRRLLAPIGAYGRLCYVVNTHDADAASRFDRSRQVAARVSAAMAFVSPEILAVGLDTVRRWARDEPGLATFARTFDRLERQRDHLRSHDLEQALSLVSDAFNTAVDTHGVLVNTDLRFEPAIDRDGQSHEVTQGTIRSLELSADRELRRTAWQSYQHGHLAYRHTLANIVSTGIKQLVFDARVRRYDSSLHASMHQSELPMDVFTNLIDTFRANLGVWHRYWRLRRQALGVETLHPWDVRAPLCESVPEVPFERAVEWIADGMRPLGEDYVATLKRGCLEERWVDIYPNRGKRMGAFCTSGPLPHPYVFMSYADRLPSLSTLAHELGHALHGQYTWTHQKRWADTQYGQFLAETAATFNQAMVRHHLYQCQDDPQFRIALIEEAMGNFHRYMFLMPTLARFEQRVHAACERGEALTAEMMNAVMAELFEEGYGGEITVERDAIGITWATFPTHICKNFYTFKYTMGISAAHALAANVIADDTGEAANRYLELLKAGGSRPPLELMRDAGVDMTTPEPIQAAFDILDQWLDRLEALLAEPATRE